MYSVTVLWNSYVAPILQSVITQMTFVLLVYCMINTRAGRVQVVHVSSPKSAPNRQLYSPPFFFIAYSTVK